MYDKTKTYIWICRICHSEFKTRKEKQLHYKQCHSEVSKNVWNKGLTKETDDIVNKIAIKNKGRKNKYKGKKIEEIYGKEKAKLIREKWKNNPKMGGFRLGSGRGKAGWYQGFWCCSSYELAYVIYCLEHNIDIQQNKDKYEYMYNGKSHTYLPDFIQNDTYIEIKGYETAQDKAKYKSIPKNKKLKVLYKKDLIKELDYCENKYGKNYTDLYETKANKPDKLCPVCGKKIKIKTSKCCSLKCSVFYKNKDKIETMKQKILEANIDYTKFGWISKIVKITGIKHQHVREFMGRYIPEIIAEKNLYIRKSASEPND